jgi:hypothetical protein
MPLYFFRISHGKFSGVSGGIDLPDQDAAWLEMTKVGGGLVGGISRNLKQNAEWNMELLDESEKPLFEIRLVAETRHEAVSLAASGAPRGLAGVRVAP